MALQKKMIPGNTLIAIIDKGVLTESEKQVNLTYLLFYGNLLLNLESGKQYHIEKKETYYLCLEHFLNSPIGQKYERPTKEEIDAAMINCIFENNTISCKH